jgi:hypothetical protein
MDVAVPNMKQSNPSVVFPDTMNMVPPMYHKNGIASLTAAKNFLIDFLLES